MLELNNDEVMNDFFFALLTVDFSQVINQQKQVYFNLNSMQ